MVVAQEDVPEHMARVEARWKDMDWAMELRVRDLGPINHASEYRLLSRALQAPSKTKSVMWLRRAVESVATQVQGASACSNGCSHCCNIAVDVSKTEALIIARETGRKISKKVQTKAVEKMPAMHWYGTPCTFLVEGKCSIYEHRPLACRTQFNMDADDLLCKLVPGESITVPYLDMNHHKSAYAEAMGEAEVYLDIRQWFPPEGAGAVDQGAADSMELSTEIIARSKRILALVDDYAGVQSSTNRTILRKALFDEFRAAALRDEGAPNTDQFSPQAT